MRDLDDSELDELETMGQKNRRTTETPPEHSAALFRLT
eukprot:IDg23470t1